MRVILVNETGVHFHTGILKEEPAEYYCSCSRKRKSSRDIEFKNNNLYITIPDKEYVALILRKSGSDEKPIQQHNIYGVSIYTTKQYMAWVRFADSYQSALQQVYKKSSLPTEEEKYIISTNKIDLIQPASSPSKIFVYESSFGDVFSGQDQDVYENYTGETTSGVQQMYTNLKRSSYSTLDSSYTVCWL